MLGKPEIKVYPVDVSSSTLEHELTTLHQNLKFSTKMPGGFAQCSFLIPEDLLDAWWWMQNRMFHRLKIIDTTKIIWEGRIQDIALLPGFVELTAYGYYASLNDGAYYTAYNDHADVIIKAILTAECPQINADQSNIDATGGPDIDSAANATYLDKSPRQIIEQLSNDFGDGSGNQYYFAIWEDRIPYFSTRNLSVINWETTLAKMITPKIKYMGGQLYNNAYAVYEAAGALARTAESGDTNSQTKYGVTRTYIVPNLGAVVAAAATAARDKALTEQKELYPTIENPILGPRVFDANGVVYPSSWVRAGQVLRIKDLVPASANLDSITRDRYSTFFIMETNYDAETQQNSLVLDIPNQNIINILQRLIDKFGYKKV